MTSSIREIIQRHSRPLSPQPTVEPSRHRSLAAIDTVLFDIYGTLLISGSGDIGGDDAAAQAAVLAEAFQAVGVLLRQPPEAALKQWHEVIQGRHRQARESGVEFPEIDIIEVWDEALALWTRQAWIPATVVDPAVLAVEFEVRANPVWPMPGMVSTLAGLRKTGKSLGIISNAQFYTLEVFPALVEQTIDGLGFEPDLQFYSYCYGQAKPGQAMYRLAVDSLSKRGISPERVLYVGNDMRNDIAPAARCGFRTALFAGDARSLRLRPDEPLCDGVNADIVVKELADLLHCLS
jgi:putative hydrolase of the HAD superfamily